VSDVAIAVEELWKVYSKSKSGKVVIDVDDEELM